MWPESVIQSFSMLNSLSKNHFQFLSSSIPNSLHYKNKTQMTGCGEEYLGVQEVLLILLLEGTRCWELSSPVVECLCHGVGASFLWLLILNMVNIPLCNKSYSSPSWNINLPPILPRKLRICDLNEINFLTFIASNSSASILFSSVADEEIFNFP